MKMKFWNNVGALEIFKKSWALEENVGMIL
jgi:hypothetical protein